jgi:STE24 endopeptidase
MNPQNLTIVFIIFSILTFLLKFFLSQKNTSFILKHWDKVPQMFAESITLIEHQKSIKYHQANSSFSKISLVYELILLYVWTLGGGIQYLFSWVSTYNYSFVQTGIIYIFAFSIISYFISLPFSLYNTFVIEEKFGFNKTTPKIFLIDQIKGLVLSILLGLPILFAVLSFLENFENNWWIYTFIVLTLYQFIIMWAYPKFIAPIFNKFEKLPEGSLKEGIFKLLDDINLKFKFVYIMDASRRTSHGNAYFTGFGKNKTIVLFDTLLKNINEDEAVAVLAHELGHLKHKHILKSMILSFSLSFISLFVMSVLIKEPWFYQMHGVTSSNLFLGLMVFSMVMGQYTFLSTPFFSYFSRKNEYEADRFAAKYAKASDLISALIKLYKDNATPVVTDQLYADFYYSHPPASLRINALEKL